MGRSHRASKEGVKKINSAFNLTSLTKQEDIGGLLAENIEKIPTRQTISRFFNGKPVSKEIFIALCHALKLEWGDIAEPELEKNQPTRNNGMDTSPEKSYQITPQQPTIAPVAVVQRQNVISDEKLIITFTGNLERFLNNEEIQKALLILMKNVSGDTSLKIEKIEKGSIKITFSGSPEGLRVIKSLIKSGELTKIEGMPIEDVQFIREKDKHRLVQEIKDQGAKGKDLNDTDLSDADLKDADLSNSDLSCADLSNANLENANLENADLNCADLSGAKLSNANLTNADFSDAIVENAKFNNNLGISSELKQDLINRGAIFEDFLIQKDIPPKIPNNPISFNLVFANLIRGNLGGAFRILKNLSRANLSGANLRDANLSGANLRSANLSGANLSGANLRSANLFRADLFRADLRSADLRGADLCGANLRSADLFRAELSGAELRSVNLRGADLFLANLSGADLFPANLSGANLSGANLRDAELSGANLIRANLSGANLRDANLSGADLFGADLRSADLRSANLIRADLSGANLIRANLRDAELSGAELSGANLRDANLSGTKVEKARFGYNPGITEYMKHDLKQRGAIFEDSTGDRSFIFTR